jgi:hypothetical protein
LSEDFGEEAAFVGVCGEGGEGGDGDSGEHGYRKWCGGAVI